MIRCQAERAIERIVEDKTLTDNDWFEFELFYAGVCSKRCGELSKLLSAKVVRDRLERDAIEHPTIQEQDKKSSWFKRRKK